LKAADHDTITNTLFLLICIRHFW